ncbi:MAG: NFACT family protein [Defluviitaleaceae bacterium]|nr:NFACT family protein [Defluviitaleaceae bacterium]
MPLDGATLSGVVHELERALIGGRVDKISQPEPDEIVLSIRSGGANYKLLLTANASAPRVHFTAQSKASPLTAPLFCMVLRKHLSGGRVLAIQQPEFERIVALAIESRNEMGDMTRKNLLIEIMGKHSNIILTDGNDKVLDAIKHVPPSLSAVRTILPGAKYVAPPCRGKSNPLAATLTPLPDTTETIQGSLFARYNGVSPLLAGEICALAQVHPDTPLSHVTPEEMKKLTEAFSALFARVRAGDFSPRIYYDETGKGVDIAPWPFLSYAHLRAEPYGSASEMLENFYLRRDAAYRLKQKTTDLRKVLSTLLERHQKKALTHEKSLADTQNRDRLRIMGELLTAYLHKIERGAESFAAENFYESNATVEIPLEPTLTPAENAQRYFRQYNKQKRAHIALEGQIAQNTADIAYLESVRTALDTASGEEDMAEIRTELAQQGFIKKIPHKKTKQRPSKPLHYTSSDGFDIYVGKNNTQNDQLTLRTAHTTDLWFHTKDIPGSHVILITRGAEPPEGTIREAANLAAYHSRGRASSNVPVDYTPRKNVRKPAGAKPGYVIYDHHKTLYITPVEPVSPINL